MATRTPASAQRRAIVQLKVSGYKSIRSEQAIQVAPLTILAGANGSGKSSIIQPLLLLKQTLEAPYDPGPLLLDGPNVRFSKASQLFYAGKGSRERNLHVTVAIEDNVAYTIYFAKGEKQGLQLSQMDIQFEESMMSLSSGMSDDAVKTALYSSVSRKIAQNMMPFGMEFFHDRIYKVVRNRCFLEIHSDLPILNMPPVVDTIQSVIHLPGLRGNPERTYPVTAVGRTFPGTFQNYTASIITEWQAEKSDNLQKLGKHLESLGLTWKVEAKRLDDTKVELRVGRTSTSTVGGAQDMVSVADVGFGVSQTLPVLVALLTAQPGQVVILEQPEIHLHPRAQDAMAGILADAAKRGVRVIAETHSSLLLLGIQTLVAEGKLSPDLVQLHWFQRDDGGETKIASAHLDEAGAFGDWPEDFGETELEAEQGYLDAADTKAASLSNAT